MKKGWKIFWIICGSLLGLGLVLCITGAAMGATISGIRDTFVTEKYYIDDRIWDGNDWVYSNDLEDYEDLDDYHDENYIRGNEEDISTFPGIRELDVEVTYLQILLMEGDSDDVIIDASGVNSQLRDKLIYGEEDGELKVDITSHSIWKKIGKNNVGKLVIQLPKEREMEDVAIDIGAGQLTIESLKSGCLDIDVGAGQAIVKQFEVKDLNISCGAGQAKLNGAANRKVDVECGVGEVEVTMDGEQEDFNYQLKCGIGTLDVGNNSYSGLGTKRHIDNRAEKQMEIDCGIGRVEISFHKGL